MSSDEVPDTGGSPSRRTFLTKTSALAMTGGLVASYGSFFAMAVRYLFPAGPRPKAWMYVAQLAAMRQGDALNYTAPNGETVTVVRQGAGGQVEDFIALSSTCPHLGCKVHWESHNTRFFCPCHNGVFTPEGKAIEGPPAQAGQSLSQYPLRVEEGLLYIEVPTDILESGGSQ